MTSMTIERAFLTLAGRQVHYRRAGSGPPVVLLHQSPKSSEELIPLIEILADDFTVLAPDTPGYGLSDPIVSPDEEVEIDVFADAVAEFFDGMGLARAGLYGLHTGAAIATRFAARYPERVMALVANGTLIKTADERADFLANYLPRFTPSWDGAHLAWAWSRMREQMIFFPWHRRDPSSRVCFPMTLEGLQINTLALLEAGDNYRTAYGTAFSYRTEEDLADIVPPARFVCAQSDPLYPYLERFPTLPPTAEIARVPDPQAGLQVTQRFFRDHVQGSPPATVPTADRPRRLSSSMVRLPSGQLHVRGNQDGTGRPVLILHEVGSSSRVHDVLAGGFIGRRPVLIPDLPGHGESDAPPPGGNGIVDTLAAALTELIEKRVPDAVELIAIGDSAAIALALCERAPRKVASLSLVNPVIVPADRAAEFEDNAVPSLRPDWGGGHLLTAWHCARDRDMFWPWFDKSAAAVLDQGLPAANPIVQQRVIDLFKAQAIHAELSHAIVTDPVADRARGCPVAGFQFTSPDRPACPQLAAQLSPRALGVSRAGWAQTILAALELGS